MRTCITLFTVGLALCWAVPAQAQKKVQSPAELLPAKTLGYAEVEKPGQLAKEVRELFKGSVLYNLPDSLEPLKEKVLDKHGGFSLWSMSILNVFTAPEMASELQRVQGAAVALLDMPADKDGRPKFVAIIQPGTSNAPGLLMRMLLTAAPVKVKETVEGVKVYRFEYMTNVSKGPGEHKFEMREGDPSMAMMPGLILIGSHQAVKDCILRAKGKGEGESLAQNKDFQAAYKKVGGEPGLFAYMSVPGLMSYAEQFAKGGPQELTQFMQAYSKLVNPKAFKAVAWDMSLLKGTLHYRELAVLDPNEKSPLLEIVPTKAVNADILHFAPKDAIMAVAMNNSDGEQRWNKLIKMADEALPVQALGGKKAGEFVKEFEKQLGFDIAKDLLGTTNNIGFAIGNPLTAPVKVTKIEGPGFTSVSSGPQIPMVLILEAPDAQGVEQLIGVIVKVSQKVAGKDVKSTSAKIKGQTVHSIKVKPDYSVEYGVAGNFVVIGPFADGVAQALADGAAKKGLLSDAKAMAQLKEFKDPISLTVIKPATLLLGMTMLSGSARMEAKPAKVEIGPDGNPKPVQPKNGDKPKTTVTYQKDPPDVEKMKKELMQILAQEPWMVMGTTRGEDFFMEEGKSPGWDKFMPKLVNYAMEKWMERPAFGFGGGSKKPLPPDIKKEERPRPNDSSKVDDNPVPGIKNPQQFKLAPAELQPEIKKAAPGKEVPIKVKFAGQAQPKQADKGDKKTGKEVLKVAGELTKKDMVKAGFYQKVHKIELTSGKKYTISLAAHKDKFFDTYLILQDAKGKDLAKNDDSGDGQASRLIYTPKQTAMFQIVVTSFSEGETGKYTLTVTE